MLELVEYSYSLEPQSLEIVVVLVVKLLGLTQLLPVKIPFQILLFYGGNSVNAYICFPVY